MVSGQITIAQASAYALIDSSTSYSVITTIFVKKMNCEPEVLDEVCQISLPSGENLLSQFCFKAVNVIISGRDLAVDLIVLEMCD